MSFIKALTLIKLLEGGKHKADAADPNDTNCGITQTTWEGLGFRGSVLNATGQDIANAYNSLWRGGGATVHDTETNGPRSLFDMIPEPTDSFAFQFYINVPLRAFRTSFQIALGVKPDGSIGQNTLLALARANKAMLLDALIVAQRQHYLDTAKPDELQGLLARVDKAAQLLYNIG